MKTNRLLLASALLLACGSTAARSHEGGMMSEDMGCDMKRHDMMDPAKRQEMAGKMFEQLDADHDGAISRAEFDKHHEQMWAKQDEERKSKPKPHDHVEQHK